MDDLLPAVKQLYEEAQVGMVRQMSDLCTELDDRLTTIREKASAEEDTASSAIGEQLKDLRSQLFIQLGIPADEWGCWAIDPRYVKDHRIAYVYRDEKLFIEKCLRDKCLGKITPS